MVSKWFNTLFTLQLERSERIKNKISKGICNT